MRRRIVLAIVILGSLLGVPALVGGTPPARADGDIPNQYIVTLRAGSNLDRVLAEWEQRAGAEPLFVYRHALFGFAIRIPDSWASALAQDSRVRTVVRDTEVSINTQTIPTGISRVFAPASSALSGNGAGAVNADIAIIDTGITAQPDLNVVGGVACNGSSTKDQNGHGSHVSGIAAALDNGDGVVGVAPGARLWAVRVLDKNGSGSTSNVICGIDWVAQHASTIEAANMSLGGKGSVGACNDGGEREAICAAVNAGVTFAVAAGNDSRDAHKTVPAAYPEVITVSALADFNGLPGGGAPSTCRSDKDDTFADFSNYGPDVDLIAPGVCITSLWKSDTTKLKVLSGTSMAAPHVTGAAALYKSTHPSATPAQVRSALIAAGNSNWSNADDHDGTKEPLLDVSSL